MCMNLDHVASCHCVLGSKSMPPTKVRPQCKAVQDGRHVNTVILSFDPNKKQSVICERNSLTMKRMGAVESDTVKSARKAKD